MEGGIGPDVPLDSVQLQIYPAKNRYVAFVSSGSRTVKVASGTLEHLLLHSPRVKKLSSKGLRTNIKLLPPENISASEWFTTTTLKRFLHVLGLADIVSIGNEITQLEETRKFQLSLSVKAEVDITSSINSKNELLRAVDLRLTALKDEVAAAFDQAIGGRCSTKDISDLENFAHHFGAKDIRDALQKFLEMSLFPTAEDLRNSNFSKTETSALGPQASKRVPPIKYNIPPEKVAQGEQQDLIEMEDSPFSSEEDQPSVERSCAPIRSTTPRRPASPMRRIQIGRSGSHRVTALTIKSLNYFPVREKVAFQRDVGNSSDEEDPEKPSKNDVLRMSVQDKISLFESKQRDHQVDIPKTKKLLKITGGPNKTVLRRWSSGMGESQVSSISTHNVAIEAESNLSCMESQICDSNAENIKPHSPEPEPQGVKGATLQTEKEESREKHPASIEWNHQKEAELKDLFTNMMENKNKPPKNQNSTSDVISKEKKSPNEQRGGVNDHYKQKRDEKLKVEAFGKYAEKEAQSKVMQMVSTNVIEPQKTPLRNSRNEPSKPSILKKNTPKMSNLPATRKSWSSSPAPSSARSPTGPTARSTTPTSRKPQPVLSEVHSTTKTEKSQPRSKNLKATASDASRTLKINNEKKQPTVTKITKTRTPEVNTAAKPSFYNNVTKNSSVVPLDTKSILLKGSGIGPGGVGPISSETKVVGQPEEASRTSGTLIEAVEDEVVMTPDISENLEECEAPGYQVVSPTKCEESINSSCDDGFKRIDLSEINTGAEEESMISPTAWVEVDNPSDNHKEEDISQKGWFDRHEEDDIIPCIESESAVQVLSPVKVVVQAGPSSPMIRRSLSQILLEENREEADYREWGNAEHLPLLIYQKDSPKGLKRLLKFGRKNKADLCTEGDNDAKDSKGARRTRGSFFKTKKR